MHEILVDIILRPKEITVYVVYVGDCFRTNQDILYRNHEEYYKKLNFIRKFLTVTRKKQ